MDDRKSNTYRILECLCCPYFDECFGIIDSPAENEDLSCAQIDIFRARDGMKGDN